MQFPAIDIILQHPDRLLGGGVPFSVTLPEISAAMAAEAEKALISANAYVIFIVLFFRVK